MWSFNRFCSQAFDLIYGPMASWPGWLSLGVISAVIGVVMLLAYKYTSWQSQIGRARDQIKASMLAMKLFKENLGVTFSSLVMAVWASFKILLLSIPPIIVAMIPMIPLLAQLAGRYQFAPLKTDQPSLVKVFLSEDFAKQERSGDAQISLEVPDGVRIDKFWRSPDSTEADWEIHAETPGMFELVVVAGDQRFTKQLPVGEPGSIRSAISPKRTNYYAGVLDNVVMLPWEAPPASDAPVRAIEVSALFTNHAPDVLPIPVLGNWIVYFLVVSIIFALIFKPFLNVKI